jgi:hypothetical protein
MRLIGLGMDYLVRNLALHHTPSPQHYSFKPRLRFYPSLQIHPSNTQPLIHLSSSARGTDKPDLDFRHVRRSMHRPSFNVAVTHAREVLEKSHWVD